MVAPNQSAERQAHAKEIGLGSKHAPPPPAPDAKQRRRQNSAA